MRLTLAAIFLALVAGLLAGCGSGGESTASKDDEKNFRNHDPGSIHSPPPGATPGGAGGAPAGPGGATMGAPPGANNHPDGTSGVPIGGQSAVGK